MRKSVNNKGFSLVEFIIAFAILSIVAAIVLMLINSSTELFARNTKRNSLQYRSQVVMAQIEQFFADCNEISVDDNGTHIKSYDDKKIYTFRRGSQPDGVDDCESYLYFNCVELKSGGTKNEDIRPFGKKNAICTCITNFSVEPSSKSNGKAVEYVIITVDLAVGDQTYTRRQVVSCRNYPTYINAVISAREEAEVLMRQFTGYAEIGHPENNINSCFSGATKVWLVGNDHISVYKVADNKLYSYALPNGGQGLLYSIRGKDTVAATMNTNDFWPSENDEYGGVMNNYVTAFEVTLTGEDANLKTCTGVHIKMTVVVNNESQTVEGDYSFGKPIPYVNSLADLIK